MQAESPAIAENLVGRVAEFLDRHKLHGAGIVVAVSGGPDSVALLRALADTNNGAGSLIVAHCNHRLRGDESDADEAFVRDLAAKQSMPLQFASTQIDVAAHAEAEGGNLEAVARRLRYRWLGEVAAQHGMRLVATGHTADDQAETVLHRLLRGTGLKGLRGIAARRNLAGDVELIRPMLAVKRLDVLSYLESLGQDYRLDATNADRRFTRNRLRHELLPLLERDFNPAVAHILGRLADQADELYAWLETEAQKLLAAAERPRAGSMLVFDRLRLMAAVPVVRREALRLAWEREGWPTSGMSAAAWHRLDAVTCGQRPAVDLPTGIRAQWREGMLTVGR